MIESVPPLVYFCVQYHVRGEVFLMVTLCPILFQPIIQLSIFGGKEF